MELTVAECKDEESVVSEALNGMYDTVDDEDDEGATAGVFNRKPLLVVSLYRRPAEAFEVRDCLDRGGSCC